MQRIEAKLTAWHRLHKQLEHVRLRLKEVTDKRDREDLDKQVRRLLSESNAARDAVHAALAAFKESPPDPAVAAAPQAQREHSPSSVHFVRFYEDDGPLLAQLTRHIATALHAGHTGIVIARLALRRELTARLEREHTHGLPSRPGTLIALDAQETLDKFMVEGWPHEGMFNHVVGKLVERSTSGGKEVAVYGEMMALLCDQGNFEAAVRLEKLWNALLKGCRFSLFCACPARLFTNPRGMASYRHLCDAHQEVLQA